MYKVPIIIILIILYSYYQLLEAMKPLEATDGSSSRNLRNRRSSVGQAPAENELPETLGQSHPIEYSGNEHSIFIPIDQQNVHKIVIPLDHDSNQSRSSTSSSENSRDSSSNSSMGSVKSRKSVHSKDVQEIKPPVGPREKVDHPSTSGNKSVTSGAVPQRQVEHRIAMPEQRRLRDWEGKLVRVCCCGLCTMIISSSALLGLYPIWCSWIRHC